MSAPGAVTQRDMIRRTQREADEISKLNQWNIYRDDKKGTEKSCSWSFSWKVTGVALIALACLAVCFVGVAAASGGKGLPSVFLSQKAYIPMIVGGVVSALGLLCFAYKMHCRDQLDKEDGLVDGGVDFHRSQPTGS